MGLTKEEVLKIANLARLELSPSEVETFAGQLSAILGHVERLNALDVEGIEPTAHAVMVATPFRDDELKTVGVQNFEPLQKSLKNSPDREGDFFKVPKVLA
ncbi:MAG: Asp-tRNA(Asn)/Glu-tRNA(Gln) amidotransferase subunit GatC [Deltaproteobacteria bacterium]|nr:Asp-tRNA(Asn)/Glu-tRNA(Gln) amidotransferase subunit GatC [Deltaproteobacteria bacterium]